MNTPRFRFAAMLALIFSSTVLFLSALLYYGVRESMEQQLRGQVSSETRQLLGDYRDEGIDELIHDISERLERSTRTRLYYTVENANRTALFDRFEISEKDGWSRSASARNPKLIILTTSLNDGFRFAVAADTRSIAELAEAFKKIMIVGVIAVFIISISIGLIVSRRFLMRIEHFRQSAEEVGSGALSTRMPAETLGEDFRPVALIINRMLDRIEHLVSDVRYVSAGIAHDLRTPLGSLRRRLETMDTMQSVDDLHSAGREAVEILDNTLQTFSSLLKISELDAGHMSIERKPVDLATLFATFAETYAPVAEDGNQSIDFANSDQAVVEGDRQLLGQLFSNLIENSFRHNGPGVAVVLRTQVRGNTIAAIVADNGAGISENQRADALKPFYRLDESRRTPGSGLGLSLATAIATRHGATLTLSNNNPGLNVQVVFPAMGRQ